jgi:hypothetical protein
MEAHQVIMEAHHLRFRHHKKLDRFKRRYHGFAPTIEIDQTVSNNSYYVALNGFMLFNSWGLNKR